MSPAWPRRLVRLDPAFGRHILLLIAAGLAGYALWRLVEAIADPEGRGTGAKALAVRSGFALRGLGHGALALAGFRLGSGRPEGASSGPEHWTAVVFGLPGGEALVWGAAAGVAATGSTSSTARGRPSWAGTWR